LATRTIHLPLGVFFCDDVPEETRDAVEMGFDHREAVIVDVVAFDSPAYDAGMQTGDLISEVNGESVSSSQYLNTWLTEHSEQKSTFTVWSMLENGLRVIEVQLN